MKNVTPDHLRVMRTAAWMWITYLVSLAILDIGIYASRSAMPLVVYHLINFFPALIFFGVSYTKWLRDHSKFITPIMIFLISAVPILVNQLFGMRLPPAPLSNLEGMVLRQLPVLIIGLILVAWQYNLTIMVIYSVVINLFELSIVYAFTRLAEPRYFALNFIIIIRMVCFIVVGLFINQLISYLRAQQESLKAANNQLTHYAGTLESLTVSRERNRMSRELHDTVIHTMSGLSVQLETIKAYWDFEAETAKNLLTQSLDTTRSGLQETRRVLKALRASPLEDLGLVVALQKLIETAAERGKLHLDVSLPYQEIILSPDVEQCIYRITQEAVENVVHHANAKHLNVTLFVFEQIVELIIQDDGIGFNPNKNLTQGHFGLLGMKERAQFAGGELTISSKPNRGTTILFMIKGGKR
jgi:signal transduction histidine kinase